MCPGLRHQIRANLIPIQPPPSNTRIVERQRNLPLKKQQIYTILSNRARRASQSSLEKILGPTSMRRGSILKTETGVQGPPERVRRPRLFNSVATRVME